jgi:flagellar hook-associated protein 1 FlgK
MEKGAYGRLDARSTGLSRIESVFGEPEEHGLAALLDRFFAAFNDLSNHPSDRGSRVQVRAAGESLARGIRDIDGRLAEYRTSLNEEINLNLEEANRLADEVAALNGEIATRTNTGMNPNDLLDRRDVLVDRLAEIVGATAIQQKDGSVSLRIGGTAIVDQTHVTRLELAARGVNDPVGAPILYTSGSEALIESGKIAALVEMRDETAPTLRNQLDELARALVTEVNAIHSQGLNGVDFFAGTGASTIGLSAAVASDAQAVNASTSGLSGDNDLALALAGLKETAVLSSNRATFGAFLRGIVTGIGSEKKAADEGLEHQALAVQLIENQREQAAGVNLDEELSMMLEAQRAFEAAARVLTTMDGLAETVLTELGR